MRPVIAATLLFIAVPLAADTFTVTQNVDGGTGSLRWAILAANATPGRDTIVLPQSGMTIRLFAPLPPITEEVTISAGILPAPVVVDGTSAGDTDGLVIDAPAVQVMGLAFTNFTGDGIVVNGDQGDLSHLTLSGNRNGIRIAGRNNAIYGSTIENNRAAGVWVTTEGSGNVISRFEGAPNQLVPWLPHPWQTDIIGGNHVGIVLDGSENMVFGATITSEPGDGIVVNGERSRIMQAQITGSGGNGITLNVPAEVSQTTGSCNGGPLIAGSSEPAPRLTSALREGRAMTIDGTLDALPNSDYQIELFDLDSSCTTGSMAFGDLFYVSTDAAGHATLHHTGEMSGANVVATATRDGATDRYTSPLSAPLTTTVNPNPHADLEVTVTGPSAATAGGLVTFDTKMTNRGPAAASWAHMLHKIPGSLSVISVMSGGNCAGGFADCRADVLGVGESITFHATFRVSQLPFDYTVIAVSDPVLGVPDPDLSNNTVTISVGVERKSRAVRH